MSSSEKQFSMSLNDSRRRLVPAVGVVGKRLKVDQVDFNVTACTGDAPTPKNVRFISQTRVMQTSEYERSAQLSQAHVEL